METQENSTFLFFGLPAEIQSEVAGWLSIRGLGVFAQLSQVCNEYASSNTIWKRYFSEIADGDIEAAVSQLNKHTESAKASINGCRNKNQIESKHEIEEPGYYKALYFRYLACEKHQWCASNTLRVPVLF